MTLRDYYIANADNKEKLYLYEISGSGVDMCFIPIGTSLEEAEQVLNRMMNNPTDEDKEFLNEYKNIKIVKTDVMVSNGKIYPRALDSLLNNMIYST